MRFLVQSTATLARAAGRRSFAVSSVVRKDLVQDMYLKELKAYKPAPTAKDAHLGAVKEFSAPKTPTPPSAPSDLAAELAAYEKAEPSLAPKDGGAATSSAPAGDHGDGGKLAGPELLKFLEQDLPPDDLHHH